jgi:hypothetical protein
VKTPILFFSLLSFLTTSLVAADAKVAVSINTGKSSQPGAAADDKSKGPPPWAPANGHRAKYSYRYFPAQEVYQRTGDGVWFYYENGTWSAGARVPSRLKVDVAAGIVLEMDTDAPYIFHVKLAHPKANPKPGQERLASAEPAKTSDRDEAKARNKAKADAKSRR